MNVKRVVGMVLATLGIFMAIYYSYMAYFNQQSYVKLMCAVAWTFPCTAVNNALMLGMGMLGLGFVLIAIGGIVVVKSRH